MRKIQMRASTIKLVAIITAAINVIFSHKPDIFNSSQFKISIIPLLLFSFVLHSISTYANFVLHEQGHFEISKRLAPTSARKTGGAAITIDTEDIKYGWLGLILISVAGPIVNILIAAVFFFLALLYGHGFFITDFLTIISVSLALGYINLIPSSVSDGGKILLSIIALFRRFYHRYISSPSYNR